MMPRHRRRSIRLQDYDYGRAGAYFVTVCSHGRRSLFGEVKDGDMHLNAAGMMVENSWVSLPYRFKRAQLDAYIVMPNHFHAILNIDEISVGAALVVAQERQQQDDISDNNQKRATTRVAPTNLPFN